MRAILKPALIVATLAAAACGERGNGYLAIGPNELRSYSDRGELVAGEHYAVDASIGHDEAGYFLHDGRGVILRLSDPNETFIPCLETALTSNGAAVFGQYSEPGSLVDIVRVDTEEGDVAKTCVLG